VQRDWRDDRIAELEAERAPKDVIIAERAARIAEQDRRIGRSCGAWVPISAFDGEAARCCRENPDFPGVYTNQLA
jgi:hypothetical protein